jgi:hypothetical protein
VIVRRERPADEPELARLIRLSAYDDGVRGRIAYPPFFPPPPGA